MMIRHLFLLASGCIGLLGFTDCNSQKPGHIANPGTPAPAMKMAMSGHEAWNEAVWLDDQGPRPVGRGGRLEILDRIGQRFAGYGARVTQQRFTLPETVPHWGGLELSNLTASMGPDCRDTLLIGTHWDTRGMADEDDDISRRELPVPGFNDGTSGVAVMLDLARRLVGVKDIPFGIEFVLFDAEEGIKGTDLYFTGSKYFASRLPPEKVRCYRAALVVDMVADSDYRVSAEMLSFSANRWLYEEIFQHGNPKIFRTEPGRVIYDDHLSLLAKGIPSALVIDLDYPYWHTRADTRENCSPESLNATSDMIYAWIESKIVSDGQR